MLGLDEGTGSNDEKAGNKSAVFGRPSITPRQSHVPLRASACASRELSRIFEEDTNSDVKQVLMEEHRRTDQGVCCDGDNISSGGLRACFRCPVECDHFVTLIVLCNMVILVLEASVPRLDIWNAIEQGLFICYLIGVLGKCIASCCQKDETETASTRTSWDIFDVVIVFIGLIDLAMFSLREQLANLEVGWHRAAAKDCVKLAQVLRIARLWRLTKHLDTCPSCIRWIHVHWKGFQVGIYAVGSACILLVLILVCCGIFLVLTVGKVTKEDPDYELFHTHMGDLWTAVVTLFQLMVEPDFVEFDRLLLFPPRPIFTAFLFLFIMLGNFGFLTMLNGVVTEEITEKNVARMRMKRQDFKDSVEKITTKACFELFGENKDKVSLKEFNDKKETLLDMFRTQGGMIELFVDQDIEIMLEILTVKTEDQPDIEVTRDDSDFSQDNVRVMSRKSHNTQQKYHIEKEDFKFVVTQLMSGVRPLLAMEHFYHTTVTKKMVQTISKKQDASHAELDAELETIKTSINTLQDLVRKLVVTAENKTQQTQAAEAEANAVDKNLSRASKRKSVRLGTGTCAWPIDRNLLGDAHAE